MLGIVSAALLGEAALDGPIMQRGGLLLGEPGGLPLLTGVSGTLDRLNKHDIGWIKAATDSFRELDHEHGGAIVHAAALAATRARPA